VAVAPSVIVGDSSNNPVAGVSVTFAVGTGGGSATGLSATTNAAGIAAVGSWTLGAVAGPNTLTATSAGLTGSPLTFNATSIVVGTPFGGGIVGYIFTFGEPGYVAGQTHGLIAATTDQSSGIIWALPANQSTSVGATSSALGTGAANTATIVAQNGAGTAYAAGLAQAYTGGGFTDWYLPSLTELAYLYTNRALIGGFANASYWSSSEGDGRDAWMETFTDTTGSQQDFFKSYSDYVRAVRTF
jgi:hypothetical protein